MSRKKIVLIVETMEKGVGRHVMDLYHNLSIKEDFEFFVLYGNNRVSAEYQQIMKKDSQHFIAVENLKREIGIQDLKSIFEIKKILFKLRPDVVHCHSSKAGLCGRIAAKMAHIKVVLYSPHAYFFKKYEKDSFKQKIFLFAEKILARFFTTYTITTSKGEEQTYLENKIDKKEKSKLIEHGLEKIEISDEQTKEIRKQWDIPEDAIIVGAMARLEEQKDPIGILKIMENVVKNQTNCYGIIFGNGTKYNSLLEVQSQSPYKNKIIIAGETNQPDVALKMMDIYLTASLYEGLPYTLIQALSQCKPIIGSNAEGNRDCIIEGKNGYKFEIGEYQKAADCIQKVITENKTKEMGEESFKIYQKRFSLQVMMEHYKKMYLGE